MVIPGNLSPELLEDALRRFMEFYGPTVIPEALPQKEHLLKRSYSYAGKFGEAFHPAKVIRYHPFNLCLAEHGLGNPHRIRRVLSPPGEVTGILSEPAK
jgi:hypothetical protein